MTDNGLDLITGGGTRKPQPGRRRASAPRKKSPWIRRILLLAVLAVVIFGGMKAWDKASSFFNGPEDYTGQGKGSVTVQIKAGASGLQIANVLEKADVVKSSDAFYQLSLKDARAQAIQPGFYELRKQMSAEWALRELSDKGNRVEGRVTVTEGARVDQIVKKVAEGSEITTKALRAALDDPKAIGLPEEANGNPEGYLYPATYTIQPGTTAEELVKQMVAKTKDVAESLDIDSRAQALGLTYEEVLTMASLLEWEGNRNEDYPKIARVFYNRLDRDIALESDATVAFANDIVGDVWTTQEQRDNPSPYNTYEHQGLPPGPIGSAGEATIEAALKPANGDWLYFVPDFEKKTTVFTTNLADHEAAAEKAREYCRTHEAC